MIPIITTNTSIKSIPIFSHPQSQSYPQPHPQSQSQSIQTCPTSTKNINSTPKITTSTTIEIPQNLSKIINDLWGWQS